MTKAKWILLYRWEGKQKVWSFEPLRKSGLKLKQKEGWRIDQCQ